MVFNMYLSIFTINQFFKYFFYYILCVYDISFDIPYQWI
jgi:hypothetical protein